MKVRSLTLEAKKGMSLGDLYPVILTIALVAILLAVVLFVLQEFGEAMPYRTVSVANESLDVWSGDTVNQTVAGAATCEFGTVTSVVVYNATEDVVITAANYTFYADAGKLINITGDISIYAWLISYDYTWRGEACDATANITEDFTDFIPWIGVILLIVAAAIVLGIVIRSFAGGSKSRV